MVLFVAGSLFAGADADDGVARRLDDAQVRAVVQRYVAAQLDPTGDRWRLGAVRLNGDTTLPDGRVSLTVSHGARVQLVGPSILHLRLASDDGVVRHLRVTAEIERETRVVLAMRDLTRGTIVAEGDIAEAYRPFRGLPRDTVRGADAALGQQLVRAIRAGAVVRAGFLTAVPVVSRGAKVILVVAEGGLRITTPGIVREDAGAGEIVRVVNAASGKVVTGRVVNAETVEVIF
jgi:flagella basal body P-ring formation protein FlgA